MLQLNPLLVKIKLFSKDILRVLEEADMYVDWGLNLQGNGPVKIVNSYSIVAQRRRLQELSAHCILQQNNFYKQLTFMNNRLAVVKNIILSIGQSKESIIFFRKSSFGNELKE